MDCGGNGAGARLNAFALVSYIPDPLAGFLDELRKELVPACLPRAHITLLPPRPLNVDPGVAAAYVRSVLKDFESFDVALTEVRIFPITDVIYIDVGEGSDALHRLHASLNAVALAFQEPFDYHPHITLAQDLQAGEVLSAYEKAGRAWAQWPNARRFRVDTATFVQNALPNAWIDLEEVVLGAVPTGHGPAGRTRQ